MNRLAAIATSHAGKVSDKWSSYLAVYDERFARYADRPVRLLEIGVLNGGSLEIWSKYFANASLVLGCDVNPACGALAFDDPRVRVVVADACSEEGLRMIGAHSGEFDIVIDDGSHRSPDIVRAFLRHFPRLASGGTYVVEDLHCSYWHGYDGGLHHPLSALSFFKRLTDVMNHEHWGTELPAGDLFSDFAGALGLEIDSGMLAGIHSVEFRNSLCIISKEAASQNVLGQRIVTGRQEAVSIGLGRSHGNGPIRSSEPGNAQPFDRPSLAQEEPDWTSEVEASRKRIRTLTRQVEVGKAGVLASVMQRAHARDRQAGSEQELERRRNHDGKGRHVVLANRRLRLDFAVDGEPVAARDFAGSLPLGEAAKMFKRSVGHAVRRGLAALRGKPVFKADAAVGLARIEPSGNDWSGSSEPGGIPGASPVISVIVACESFSAGRARSTVDSLFQQTGRNWHLVICSAPDIPPSLQVLAAGDGRITLVAEPAGGYAAALRTAAAHSRGDFVMVLRPGDRLAPNAIAALSGRLSADRRIDILYADEAIAGARGTYHSPQLKPEWSPELLTAYNYFGRPTVVRRTALLGAGSFDTSLGQACEWELYLRLAQPFDRMVATPRLRRLPGVLCHRHPDTGNDRPLAGDPASADFRRALQKHWRAQGIDAGISTEPDGTLRAVWPIAEPPLVSVIIPSRDKADLLRVCLDGLIGKTAYRNVEIIVVDNGSTEAATRALYDDIRTRGVRVVDLEGLFNYSRACNVGAAASRGTLLLFLNNDVEILNPEWLDDMVRYALRPGVGVVGAKLVYPDGALQHAGVVISRQLFGTVFRYADEFAWGPFGSPSTPRNWLGVTGACQMIRREVYDRIGGFDERYRIAVSDIKLTLDVWRAGYRIAYTPFARLLHHEGATRGRKGILDDAQCGARDMRALGFDDDPYFHPALNAIDEIPALRRGGQSSLPTELRSTVARLAGSLDDGAVLDIYDDGAVAFALGLRPRDILWLPDPVDALADGPWAARLMVDLLRRRRDLRHRFPTALSDGPCGDFALWLKHDAAARFGLPPGAAEAIDRAFQLDLGAEPLDLLRHHEALWKSDPPRLPPEDRRDACRLLFGFMSELLPRESIWWFLLATAERSRSATG